MKLVCWTVLQMELRLGFQTVTTLKMSVSDVYVSSDACKVVELYFHDMHSYVVEFNFAFNAALDVL